MSEQMSRNDFHEFLPKSLGTQMIVSGLTTLVEDERFDPRQALQILEIAGQECFFALHEIKKEVSK
ncbi:hypothetical protein ACQKMD_11035 [Viridibacillus sp. NPDC096237]|uniref:hypothetical protein n=1 Tax=Viridibacillus sp. NPDC096237 TaxID=3390721 RepID=UPI003D094FE5